MMRLVSQVCPARDLATRQRSYELLRGLVGKRHGTCSCRGMESTKTPNDVRSKHQRTESDDARQPAARPRGGSHTTHPETVKPNELGKGPTKKARRSRVDGRTKDDKDGNEQQ